MNKIHFTIEFVNNYHDKYHYNAGTYSEPSPRFTITADYKRVGSLSYEFMINVQDLASGGFDVQTLNLRHWNYCIIGNTSETTPTAYNFPAPLYGKYWVTDKYIEGRYLFINVEYDVFNNLAPLYIFGSNQLVVRKGRGDYNPYIEDFNTLPTVRTEHEYLELPPVVNEIFSSNMATGAHWLLTHV